MTIQISMIGLGQIGASVGLALSEYAGDIVRVGHDKDPLVSRKAKQKEAIDKVALTLSKSVKDADAVLLALPAHEIRPTLEHIAQDLKEDAVVMDTAPMKRVVGQWAEELLPPKRYYVGVSPVVNFASLRDFDYGIEAARQDLFEGTLMALVAGQKASTQAVNFAANFIKLLGAEPYFVGEAEMDGLMTKAHILPHLTAAALISATAMKPGWQDVQKFAGRAYAQASEPISFGGSPEALARLVLHNSDNVEIVINALIRALQELKQSATEQNEEALEAYFQEVYKKRDRWWIDKEDEKWSDAPSNAKQLKAERGSLLTRMMGFDPARRRRMREKE